MFSSSKFQKVYRSILQGILHDERHHGAIYHFVFPFSLKSSVAFIAGSLFFSPNFELLSGKVCPKYLDVKRSCAYSSVIDLVTFYGKEAMFIR